MSEVEVVLKTSAEVSGTWKGDASARTHTTLNWPWSNSTATDFVGTDAKALNPENVMFLRYDISGLPSGITYKRAKLVGNSAAVTIDSSPGKIRVGFLTQDGKWNHASAGGWESGSSAWQYANSYDLPFPTGPGTDTINAGVLVADGFLGTVEYTTSHANNLGISFGDPSYEPTFNLHDTGDYVAFWIGVSHALSWDHVAFVLDPADVPGASESIQFLTDDNPFLGEPKGSWGIRLYIVYEENPPTITSANPTTAARQGEVWTDHTVTATDPTGQTVTFSLDSAPSGMTINSSTGLITWVDTASLSPGSYVVNVRATDPDGFVDTQQITAVLKSSEAASHVSEVSIANAALILLGERRISSFEDGTKAARLVKERYADVRDELLRTLPWNFATKRAQLAASATPPIYEFARAFELPSDFVRLLDVDNEFGWAYRLEGTRVVTDIEAPLLITYIAEIENSTDMDASFRNALSASLAIDLAEVLTGSSVKLQEVFDIFRARIAEAWTVNGQENLPLEIDASEWQRARGREDD